jgi:uncharacterized protein
LISSSLIAILTGVAFVAGIFDGIAGGGGLLVLPALLLAGLDPASALATNKLQGSFGTGSAAIEYARHGHIDFRKCRLMVATTFAASCLGVAAVGFMPTSLLEAAMPVLLVFMALYFAFSPRVSDIDVKARMSIPRYSWTMAPAIGFYDGIFGPGAGSFYLLGFVTLLGYGVLRASAHTKLLNFTSNIAALLVFALSGKIVWLLGLSMGVGQFLGARLGSRLAIKNGAALIRPLLVIVCCAMAARLLFDPENPLRAFFP